MGEIVVKGNVVAKGYLLNEKGTNEAFEGGAFRTGDMGVMHPNGRVQIKDRSKDIIISGGENICSIEVENLLQGHPNIQEVAVIAEAHPHWDEVPVAFVKFKVATEQEEIISWTRDRIAHFKAPKKIIPVDELPRTSTGKVQKHILRDRLKSAVNKANQNNKDTIAKE